MIVKFIKKRIVSKRFHPFVVQETNGDNIKETQEENRQDTDTTVLKTKNKTNKRTKQMTESEKFDKAEEIVSEIKPEVKLIKKEKGLIERTESSKIVLNEDNKQILND